MDGDGVLKILRKKNFRQLPFRWVSAVKRSPQETRHACAETQHLEKFKMVVNNNFSLVETKINILKKNKPLEMPYKEMGNTSLWKETQREVRQHWFIYSYISAYIQALYMYCPGLLEYVR